jgi:hypothetical protein
LGDVWSVSSPPAPATHGSPLGWLLLGIALASLMLPAFARAHGPCNCSFPQLGDPGARVTTRSPAYKIVFNPRPTDYVTEMKSAGYASAYQPGAPTATVMSRPVDDPVRRASFRVPEVPPGVYLVLIYDGSEGGTHSTWDYFHVLGAAPAPRTASDRAGAAPATEDGVSPALLALGVLGGLILGAATVAALRRRS